MTVRIDDTARSANVQVRVTLDATPDDDLTSGEGRYKRTFRPGYLSLRYHQTPTDPAWRVTSCVVSGPIVKKNGELGEARGRLEWDNGYTGDPLADAPQWVQDMVASNTPADFYWAD